MRPINKPISALESTAALLESPCYGVPVVTPAPKQGGLRGFEPYKVTHMEKMRSLYNSILPKKSHLKTLKAEKTTQSAENTAQSCQSSDTTKNAAQSSVTTKNETKNVSQPIAQTLTRLMDELKTPLDVVTLTNFDLCIFKGTDPRLNSFLTD